MAGVPGSEAGPDCRTRTAEAGWTWLGGAGPGCGASGDGVRAGAGEQSAKDAQAEQAGNTEAEAGMHVSMPKQSPKRSQKYLRWVASRRSAHCGRLGPSQAAHADAGKGMGIKSSDETVFALCADAPGRLGCHATIGATGLFTRDHRRQLEANYAASTRATAIIKGAWPKDWT